VSLHSSICYLQALINVRFPLPSVPPPWCSMWWLDMQGGRRLGDAYRRVMLESDDINKISCYSTCSWWLAWFR
jgi:hypothetical protein